MNNNISRIGNAYFKPEYKVGEEKQQKQEAKNEEKANGNEQKQVSSEAALNYLANANIDMVTVVKRQADRYSKLIANAEAYAMKNPETAANIAASVNKFADTHEALTKTAMNEFGIPEDFAESIATTTVNNLYV